DTGFAYVVGGGSCAGGLHMVDVRDPMSPTFAGCFAEDGYTHDAQCIVYDGPDEDYAGREVCFAFNEDTVAFVDQTDKAAPALIAEAFYPNFAYTHQGWIDEWHRFLYVDDELDELNGLVAETRTLRFDVRDLDAPAFVTEFFHGTQATDHNLYVVGSTIYASN